MRAEATRCTRCWSRGLVASADAPAAIPLDRLYIELTPSERRAWHCWAGTIAMSDAGLDAAGVERFLRSLESN